MNFVNDPTAVSFKDRVNLYTNNQISYNNASDSFLIDENRDNITDYTISNPDFSFAQLQTNLVVRWEYIPGSELFFVWARGSSGLQNVADSLSEGIRRQVIDAPAEDTFLIKATYRFVR